MPDLEADLFNLAMSEQAQPLMDAVKKHIADNVEPITEEFFALDKENVYCTKKTCTIQRKLVSHRENLY